MDEPAKRKETFVSIISRIVLGAVFFIAGFNFSNTLFFQNNPLFGVPFLAEALISLVMALFGFHTLPIIARNVKDWFEGFLAKTVSKIVSDFWEQQSKRMQQTRREKQKQKKFENEQKNKEKLSGGLLLDTSVLIDGRILDIVKTGFLDGPFIILDVVVKELHLVADNEDFLKRQKGRRGLDVVNELKKTSKVHLFRIFDKNTQGAGVDQELIQVAKKFKIRLMTLDYNLNKVATVAGVKVLNINDLSNAIKPALLPGEELKVKIVQSGKEKEQGVGYLSDGTMIVVEGAKEMVGQEADVKVTRVIQTPAGKMIFSTLTKTLHLERLKATAVERF